MNNDPKAILADSQMNAFQITAVGICIFLNALDGFDVLAISFASPGIVDEWNINRAELGVVLAMELVGMAAGSVFLGGIADKIGRRPTILGCLVVMSLGMYAAAQVNSPNMLLLVRFATGLGIGGMLASINAMAAEYSNKKHRNLSVILMSAGYPLGAILGGSVASTLLVYFDWRAVFVFGAIITASALILVWFLMPESIEYLVEKRPAGALEKINLTLKRMGHPQVERLIEHDVAKPQVRFTEIFSARFLNVTLMLTLAYFFHIMAFYYIIKWIPKLVVDMQYAASTAGSVLVWANVGGALGALIIGILATKMDLRRVTIAVMLVSVVMISVFGMGQTELWQLSLIAAATGFFTNSGIVCMYAMFAQYFPASLRASGTGFIIGVGRGDAALGPVVAGLMFSMDCSLQSVSLVMASSAGLAALSLFMLKQKPAA